MNKLFIAFLLILLVLPMASAANSHTTATFTNNGLIIDSPSPSSIKQNQNYTFFWYVQNQTNSAFLNSSSISCAIEIYKSTGYNGIHVTGVPGVFDGVEEWSAYIAPGNFSTTGEYFEKIKCNSTLIAGLGGIVTSSFYVTQSGEDFNSINWLPIILVLFFIITVMCFIAVTLAKEHSIVSIFFILLSLFLMNPLLGMVNLIVENYISYSPLLDQIGVFLTLMPWIVYFVLLYIVVYILLKSFESWQTKKNFRLGLEGTR